MDEVKSGFKSRTIWAAAAVILVGGLQIAGYVIADADAKSLPDLLFGCIQAVAGVVAWWGRVRATKRIG
jgi:hypothetical protein